MFKFINIIRILVSYMICYSCLVRRFEKNLMYSLCDNNCRPPPIKISQFQKQIIIRLIENLCSFRSAQNFVVNLALQIVSKFLIPPLLNFQLKLKDTMHINWEKPNLNQQVNHDNLTLTL